MNKLGFAAVRGVFCLGLLLLLSGAAQAQTLRLEAQLVWGTDDAKSPNPKHHPVDADLAKRLGKSPYRWKNYFKVNQQIVEIPSGATTSGVVMSDQCTLDIKNLGGEHIEVRLHGKGKPVSTHREQVGKNNLLILAGDAGNETAWLVIIRQTQAPVVK